MREHGGFAHETILNDWSLAEPVPRVASRLQEHFAVGKKLGRLIRASLLLLRRSSEIRS